MATAAEGNHGRPRNPGAVSTMTEAEEAASLTEPIVPGLLSRELRYAAWLAIPEPLREPETVQALATELGVDRRSLSRWARLPRVLEAVAKLRDAWLKGGTVSDVLGHMVTQAGDRDAAAVPAAKLVLEAAGLMSSTEAKGGKESATELTLSIDGEEITVQLRQATKG